MKIQIDNQVYILEKPTKAIDLEKAFVELDENTLWAYLINESGKVGIAFAGTCKYAVDAIVETKDGAMGDSHSGSLSGVQILLGREGLEEISRLASENDFPLSGYKTTQEFLQEATSRIADVINGGKSEITIKDGFILLGRNDQNQKIILVIETDKLVFIKDEEVFVLSDEKLVYVNESGVEIGSPGKRSLVVGPNGISGIPGLANIGPQIARAVTSATAGLKKLKHLKGLRHTMKHVPHAFDDVDDFDWDDDE